MGWLSKTVKKAGGLYKKGFQASIGAVANPLGMNLGGGGGRGPQDNGQEAAIREGYGAGLSSNAQALASLPKQFEPARNALTSAKTSALKASQDAGAQANANVQQDAVGRGLSNTTVLDNARQGVASDVSRRATDIESLFAQEFGRIAQAEGNQRQQLLGRKGQLQVGMGEALAGQRNRLQSMQYDWESSQNPNAWLDSLLGIGGTALGTYIGKKL